MKQPARAFIPKCIRAEKGWYTMDALTCIETRRSIRKYQEKPIPHEVMEEIVKEASFAPSWKNSQVVRDVVVENPEIKSKIANEAVLGFAYNTGTIEHAAALVVVTMIHGRSGYERDGSFTTSKEEYCSMVEKTKHYIKEGDIFQGVISRRFEAEYDGSLLNAYRVLRTTNPSPYMYYMQIKDMQIAGTSPETMVKLTNGKLMTFPVAGTRQRGKSIEEDQALEKELLADEKECAEHNMLVDLARNDLGRISEYGSVKVADYMAIHRFSKVMHIASTVVGDLAKGKTCGDTIEALLPAGTLSGAPKFRACEIIDELEPVARGVYGGAIGYMDFSGNLDVCIAIRTAVKKGKKVYVQAGAGIVADSIPENEYQECANKAGAVIEAIRLTEEVCRA